MKFTNEVSEKMKVALAIMLYSTGGEDEETMRDTEITTIGPNIFHVTYKLNDPYDAMDFQVAIDVRKDSMGSECSFHYNIFRSVYGDNGEFSIDIK